MRELSRQMNMYLEVPDKDLRIDDPSEEDIARELNGMMGVRGGDNCLDLCQHGSGFIQVIGSASSGFFLRFRKADGKIYQSRGPLVIQKAQSIPEAYLLSGCYPRDDAQYREIKTPSKRPLFG